MSQSDTETEAIEEPLQVSPLVAHPLPHTSTPGILLVEDNPSNRTVALEQLSKLGYQADVALNGVEAVARLSRKEHGYQLVLMDCQMPGMDGFAATAAIRRWEQEHGGHLPIVAMTAQALKGDRERCIAAGMDDYLTKPVRLNDLRQALAWWA